MNERDLWIQWYMKDKGVSRQEAEAHLNKPVDTVNYEYYRPMLEYVPVIQQIPAEIPGEGLGFIVWLIGTTLMAG